MKENDLIQYMIEEAVIKGVNQYGLEGYEEAIIRVYSPHCPVILEKLQKSYKKLYKL